MSKNFNLSMLFSDDNIFIIALQNVSFSFDKLIIYLNRIINLLIIKIFINNISFLSKSFKFNNIGIVS